MASSAVTAALRSEASCIFCNIVAGKIPCHKLLETQHVLAFLDVNPLAKGHALVIPRTHAERLHDVPDHALADMLPMAKQVANTMRRMGILDEYNLLQNNGRLAHQEVGHVHLHLIPKPDADTGLGIRWPVAQPQTGELAALAEEFRRKHQDN